MSINTTNLEIWNDLEDKWTQANKETSEAQIALDYKLRTHLLDSNAPAPKLSDQEEVNSLWAREAKLRKYMDEFLSERLSKDI